MCCAAENAEGSGKCCRTVGDISGKNVEGAPQSSEVMGIPPSAPPGVGLKADLVPDSFGNYPQILMDNADLAAGGNSTSASREVTDAPDKEGSRDEAVDMDFSDGSKYSGQLREGLRHGHGRAEHATGSYEGQWQADKHSGAGKQIWTDGRTFEGQFLDGKFEGHGKMVWLTQKGTLLYEGDYKADLKHGTGRFAWGDGRAYDGEWKDGMRNGRGKYTNANNQMKIGYWIDDKFDNWEASNDVKKA